MQKRSFLSAILLAGTAPAIVKASSLMKIVVSPQNIIIPRFGGFIDSLTITRGISDIAFESSIYPDKLIVKGVGRGRTSPIYQVDELGWFDPLNPNDRIKEKKSTYDDELTLRMQSFIRNNGLSQLV